MLSSGKSLITFGKKEEVDPYWENNILLLKANSKDSGIKDFSTNNLSCSSVLVGNTYPILQTDKGLYFKNNYVSIPMSSNIQLGLDDFTFEVWVKPANSKNQNTIYFDRSSGNYTGWGFSMNHRQLSLIVGNGSYWVVNMWGNQNIEVPLNVWSHVAVVRKNKKFNLWLNGQWKAASAIINDSINQTGPACIGYDLGLGYNSRFEGWMKQARFTREALYVGPIDDSQYGAPGHGPYTLNFDNTSEVLLNTELYIPLFNSFEEKTGKSYVVGQGLASTQKDVSKFPKFSSINFLESTTNIANPIEVNTFSFLNEIDFTIEFWLKGNSQTSNMINRGIFGRAGSSFQQRDWLIKAASSERVIFQYASDGRGFEMGKWKVNEWTHHALTRQNGRYRGFVDGQLYSDTGDNVFWRGLVYDSYSNPTARTLLGYNPISAQQSHWNGEISDVRVTKGVARYTENFTVPKKSFPVTPFTQNQVEYISWAYSNGYSPPSITTSENNLIVLVVKGIGSPYSSENLKYEGSAGFGGGGNDYISVYTIRGTGTSQSLYPSGFFSSTWNQWTIFSKNSKFGSLSVNRAGYGPVYFPAIKVSQNSNVVFGANMDVSGTTAWPKPTMNLGGINYSFYRGGGSTTNATYPVQIIPSATTLNSDINLNGTETMPVDNVGGTWSSWAIEIETI